MEEADAHALFRKRKSQLRGQAYGRQAACVRWMQLPGVSFADGVHCMRLSDILVRRRTCRWCRNMRESCFRDSEICTRLLGLNATVLHAAYAKQECRSLSLQKVCQVTGPEQKCAVWRECRNRKVCVTRGAFCTKFSGCRGGHTAEIVDTPKDCLCRGVAACT